MYLRTSVALIVAAWMAGTPGASQPEQIASPIALGIVRADGLLVPFARWDGASWSNGWPAPARTASLPIRPASVPPDWWGPVRPVTTWQVTYPDGARSDAVVSGAVSYPTYCQQGVALASSARVPGSVPSPLTQPYPKLGLAASAPLVVTPIAAVAPSAVTWQATARAVQARVPVLEEPIARRFVVNGWRHPIARFDRRRVPVVLELLARTPLGEGRFLYAFEAAKRYPDLGPVRQASDDPGDNVPPDCPVTTVAQGWFVAGYEDRLVWLDRITLRLATCTDAEVERMLPLGLVRVGGDALWIAQLAGRYGERYVLLRWDDRRQTMRTVLSTSGGSCARE